jgi:hypothetical protein
MADTKISALTASTTPLAGTEVLPIVQSGTTKQVSVANLTAGRAVSALSLSTTGGYTFRVADASAYELLRSVGATNNPGIFVKAIEATKKVSLYGSGSGISGQLLTLGAEAVEDSLRVSATDVTVAYGNVVVGTAGKGINFSANGGVLWRCGAGTPEGAVTAPVGSLYTRTDGGLLSTLYVKESGTGNTGWVAK